MLYRLLFIYCTQQVHALLNVPSTQHLALILAICSPLRCIRSCSDSCSLATLFCWYNVLGLNTPSSSCCCRCSTAESAPATRTTSCCLACVPCDLGRATSKIDCSCVTAKVRLHYRAFAQNTHPLCTSCAQEEGACALSYFITIKRCCGLSLIVVFCRVRTMCVDECLKEPRLGLRTM